jgi:hypothetical protein
MKTLANGKLNTRKPATALAKINNEIIGVGARTLRADKTESKANTEIAYTPASPLMPSMKF